MAMLPYCRAPATEAPVASAPPALALSCGTLTLARSSRVIFSAGLSSVFAMAPLFRRRVAGLGIRRRFSSRLYPRGEDITRRRRDQLHDTLARLLRVVHDRLAHIMRRAPAPHQQQHPQYESHTRDSNVRHDLAGPPQPGGIAASLFG